MSSVPSAPARLARAIAAAAALAVAASMSGCRPFRLTPPANARSASVSPTTIANGETLTAYTADGIVVNERYDTEALGKVRGEHFVDTLTLAPGAEPARSVTLRFVLPANAVKGSVPTVGEYSMTFAQFPDHGSELPGATECKRQDLLTIVCAAVGGGPFLEAGKRRVIVADLAHREINHDRRGSIGPNGMPLSRTPVGVGV